MIISLYHDSITTVSKWQAVRFEKLAIGWSEAIVWKNAGLLYNLQELRGPHLVQKMADLPSDKTEVDTWTI